MSAWYETKKKLLHVGPAKSGVPGVGFDMTYWQEVRFDIDPVAKPDILGDMRDMVNVADESFDAIYTSHTIEHLYPSDVKRNLEEYLRVLKPDGFLVLACPDLEEAAKMIAEGRLLDVAYESGEGPITPLDILYGYRGYFTLLDRRDFMTHRTGFTMPVLISSLESVGFKSVIGHRRTSSFELCVYASKGQLSYEQLTHNAGQHLPL